MKYAEGTGYLLGPGTQHFGHQNRLESHARNFVILSLKKKTTWSPKEKNQYKAKIV